jgi:glycosyltransferase involved in cell wall biosynthesis
LFITDKPVIERGGYILYVGSLEPRKNIASLVEAYELMRLKYPLLSVKLVLIGGESPLFSEVRLRAKRFQEDVVFKGFVSDEELVHYYRHANLVAYPSLYEGFGLPPLESMACGTPVITSNVSSLPEVVGMAAITVDPKNIHELCDAMASVLLSSELSGKMIENGISQVAEFNWERVARQTIGVYHESLDRLGVSNSVNSHITFEQWKSLKQPAANS